MSQDIDDRLAEYVRTKREERERQRLLPPGRYVRDCPACNGNGFIIKKEQRPCVSCTSTGQLKCSSFAEGARRVSEWEWAG